MMQFLLLVCCLFPVLISGTVELPERARGGIAYKRQSLKSLKDYPALTWDAQVDNFDENTKDTYKQRYYVNAEYWDGKGPVFYEIGGEGTLNGPPSGYIAELGKQYNALLIGLEHRFYGESIPNGVVTTENYQYLTVEQALADLAAFTDYYKGMVKETATVPWFVFGGSYPGALSSWYRKSYPEHSVGSLSSSGVVNCIIDFYQFDMQVSAATSNECTNKIKLVQSTFEKTIKRDSDGLQKSLALFNCEKDMSENDFYYMIADSWSMAVQYSSKTSLCSALSNLSTESSEDEIMTTFAEFSKQYWGNDFCSGGFYNTKALADPARWDINSRSWRYQTCSQVSYFNTAPPSGSLRAQSVNLEYHLNQCEAVFGEKIFPSSKEMNQKYGAEFPTATNVFYSDFSDDPWQRASVTYPVAADQPYYLTQCDDCGHCMDFHTPNNATDPDSLKISRQQFEVYLSAWLNQY